MPAAPRPLQMTIDHAGGGRFEAFGKDATREFSDRLAYCCHDLFRDKIKESKENGSFVDVRIQADATPLLHQGQNCQVLLITYNIMIIMKILQGPFVCRTC